MIRIPVVAIAVISTFALLGCHSMNNEERAMMDQAKQNAAAAQASASSARQSANAARSSEVATRQATQQTASAAGSRMETDEQFRNAQRK